MRHASDSTRWICLGSPWGSGLRATAQAAPCYRPRMPTTPKLISGVEHSSACSWAAWRVSVPQHPGEPALSRRRHLCPNDPIPLVILLVRGMIVVGTHYVALDKRASDESWQPESGTPGGWDAPSLRCSCLRGSDPVPPGAHAGHEVRWARAVGAARKIRPCPAGNARGTFPGP